MGFFKIISKRYEIRSLNSRPKDCSLVVPLPRLHLAITAGLQPINARGHFDRSCFNVRLQKVCVWFHVIVEPKHINP